MTFTDAAHEVLKDAGRPLHYKEITELAIEQNLLSHVGKSPEVTMGARLAATLKKEGEANPLIRVKPGVFALRHWDEDTIKAGLSIKRSSRKAKAAPAPAPAEAQAEPSPSNGESKTDVARLAQDVPQTEEERMRAEIAASAQDLFAAEDDDDQPILKSSEETEATEDKDDKEEKEGGRRRRRRRRRRGRGGASADSEGSDDGLPSYTASPATDEGSGRGQVVDFTQAEIPNMDGLSGMLLADAVGAILSSFDRGVGAVSLRQIVDAAQKKGKLNGDLQIAQSQVAAAVRADNARRGAHGERPRFRVTGGRIALTHWFMRNDLARLERDAVQSLHKYRDAACRSIAAKISELPGHAFVEFALLVLERMGVSDMKAIKFPGASGAEVHFSGVLHVPGTVDGQRLTDGGGISLAIVIRKDGRDLGRERVTELRGSAHHYDSATVGWLVTSGQMLSGAREETKGQGTMPVSLLDAAALARLCEEHGVGVVKATHTICVPDVDLFEALRAT